MLFRSHDNPLAAMAFNSSGTRIATASEKGTVIRVFSVPEGQKQFEFRRGVKRCVSIYSLAFSPDSLFLCCSSNTESVHIFKLENTKENRTTEDPQSWMGFFGQALKTSAKCLPSQVTEMFNQGRDFAIARLPFSGLKNVCTLTNIQKVPRLLVACQDGYLYIYNLDPMEGGECTLLKQHRLDGQLDTMVGVAEVSSAPSPVPQAAAVTYSPAPHKPAGGADQAASGEPATTTTTQASPPKGKEAFTGAVKPSYARAVVTLHHPLQHASPQERREYSLAQAIHEADSEPYQDIEQTGSGEDAPSQTLGALRLDDDNEFPPMTHKTD